MSNIRAEYNYNPTQAFQNEVELSMLRNILESLPLDSTIRWSHDNFRISPYGVIANYLDIYAPDLCDPVGINWLLTVNNHLSDQIDNDFVFPLAEQTLEDVKTELLKVYQKNLLTHDEIFLNPDKYMVTSRNEMNHWYQFNNHPLASITYPTQPKLKDIILSADSNVGSEEPLATFLPMWSYDLINHYLQEWAFQISGRQDLNFEFIETLSTPLLDHLKSIDLENEKLYDLGDDIKVTGQAFDTLLTMNENDSVAIMKKLKGLK